MISGLFVGIAFGVLLQRTQFCFNSGFQNIFLQKNFRFLAALLIAVSIQAVGFFVLAHFGLIRIPDHKVPILATLIGGFLLGLGIIICGYCAIFGLYKGAALFAFDEILGLFVLFFCAAFYASFDAGFKKYQINRD